MKSSAWLFAAAMSVPTLALAQTAQSSGVTETTDPAKIAAIEQRAQELASRPPAMAPGNGGPMKKHGMRHHKNKATPSKAKKDKPVSDMPMATDSKS